MSTSDIDDIAKEFSKWALMNEIYRAKKDYYKGTPKLTDREYDALEKSFKAIHGEEVFNSLYSVDYNGQKHAYVLFELEKLKQKYEGII